MEKYIVYWFLVIIAFLLAGIKTEKPKKPVKHKYGEYNNVLLTDEELQKLKEIKEFLNRKYDLIILSFHERDAYDFYYKHEQGIRRVSLCKAMHYSNDSCKLYFGRVVGFNNSDS